MCVLSSSMKLGQVNVTYVLLSNNKREMFLLFQLLCCGVTNGTDWNEFHPRVYGPGQTPDSCCITHVAGCGMDTLAAKWERVRGVLE